MPPHLHTTDRFNMAEHKRVGYLMETQPDDRDCIHYSANLFYQRIEKEIT